VTSAKILLEPPSELDEGKKAGLQRVLASDGLERCIRQILIREEVVQAWEHLDFGKARRWAAELDLRTDEFPLRGIIAGVKDIFDTDDMPTGRGSPIHKGRLPSFDAASVSLLRANGAVILGKTVSTEFACSLPSRTRNPTNPAFSAGGSSSGSAAAVAAGMVDVALGTQTLGSVIRPASFCGVVGFKPSFGRISRAGVFSLSSSLDTVGVLGKDVDVIRRVYEALSGDFGEGHRGHSSYPPRIAIATGSFVDKATTDAAAAIDVYHQQLRSRGYDLEEIELGDDFEQIGSAARIVHDFEVGQRFVSEGRSRWCDLSPNMHGILDRAKRIPVSCYEDAVLVGEAARVKYSAMLAPHDGLITLAALGEAPFGNASTGDPAFNTPWTFLHVPCLSLPLLRGAEGLPIGVQIVGARFADNSVLDVARHLESSAGITL
jgi:Asp-tRNA(Asn)/Glu-tRNA(Gln) amidotransferase A subunit family amidase